MPNSADQPSSPNLEPQVPCKTPSDLGATVVPMPEWLRIEIDKKAGRDPDIPPAVRSAERVLRIAADKERGRKREIGAAQHQPRRF